MAKIKNIRILIANKTYPELHEIFKITLSLNDDNFYLTKNNGAIKISFHKTGVKYLRLKDKFYGILYKDQHYNLQNLNPVLLYIPKELDKYPLFEGQKKGTADIKILNESNNTDIAVKIYRVNYKNGGVYIKENDKNISSFKLEAHDFNNHLITEDRDICLFDFGQQKLYFDFCHINRKNIENIYEHIILFKPSTELDITNYITSLKLPAHKGIGVSQNKNDETYYISF